MRRKALIVILGLVAALMALQLTFALALRKTRVDLLVEVLASSDAADAAWAFERLKEIDLASLEDLLPYLWSRETTLLWSLSWKSPRPGFSEIDGIGCFEVREVARFVFSGHLSEKIGNDDWTGLADRYRRSLREALRARPDQARPVWKNWLNPVPPRVTPPSEDPRTASLATEGSGEALIQFLKCADSAGAVWALAHLKVLPDGELSKLLPLATAQELIPLRQFAWRGNEGYGTLGLDRTANVGQVVRCLIAERVGAIGLVEARDLTREPAPAHLLEKLSWDLDERLARSSPAPAPRRQRL